MNDFTIYEFSAYKNGEVQEYFLASEVLEFLAARATPAQPVQSSLREAIEAMDRAKKLPIWDNDVPHKLHVELDIIFKALCAQPSPSSVGAAIRKLKCSYDTIGYSKDKAAGVAIGFRAAIYEAAAIVEQVQGQAESLRQGGLSTVAAWKMQQAALKMCRKVETGAAIDNDKSASDYKQGIVKGAADCIYAIGLLKAEDYAAPSIAQDGQGVDDA